MITRITNLWRRLRAANPFAAYSSLNAATNIAQAGLGVLSGVLAARLLGARGRGELAAIQNVAGALGLVAAVGMPETILYYGARAPALAASYTGSGICLAVLCSLPFIVGGYALMPLLLHAQTPAIIAMGRVYLLIVPICALSMTMVPLRARTDFVSWNLLRAMPNLTWLVLLVVAWLLARATPTFLAGANLVVVGLLLIPYALIAIRRVPGSFVPQPRRWPEMLRYGLPCVLTGVPQLLNLRLDQMLMAALVPPGQLGLYVVAVAWSSAPTPLLNAVGMVITPAVASDTDDARGARRLAAAARTTAVLALATCACAMAATPLAIMGLFGYRFRAAIPAALILMPASGVLGINYVFEEGLRAMARPYAVLRAELLGLVVTGAALVGLLGPFGIVGAAVASLLGYSTVTVALLISIRARTGLSLVDFLVPRSEEVRNGLNLLLAAVRGRRAVAG